MNRKPSDQEGFIEGLKAELSPEDQEHYLLRLYVTGMTPRSVEALASIRAVCEEYLPGRYELEVIDIYQNPAAAREAQVVAMPTLVKRLPLPLRRLIGDLSTTERVLKGLNLPGKDRHA